ncbi:MAG: hypothetical protein FJZ01_28800 [Candidatus Sericytochromatia bacterium]|nr:hypothetical protein [Candidatus Tanganyikabacteria bacterium]
MARLDPVTGAKIWTRADFPQVGNQVRDITSDAAWVEGSNSWLKLDLVTGNTLSTHSFAIYYHPLVHLGPEGSSGTNRLAYQNLALVRRADDPGWAIVDTSASVWSQVRFLSLPDTALAETSHSRYLVDDTFFYVVKGKTVHKVRWYLP